MDSESVEIVLVEDNPYDVEMTLRCLEKNKLANKIRVLRDGAEAVEYFFGSSPISERSVPLNQPRLVLLDLKLPKFTGIEVLEKLKSNTLTRRIPVVVLTSSREDRDIVKCYELGVNSYIVKPVDFEQFSQAIHQLGLYWLLLNQSHPG